MNAIKKFFKSLTPFEIILWSGSLVTVVFAFVLTRNTGYIQLAASLVGACMLMLNAKGNVWGQVLSVVFSAFYGTVSWFAQYYGEMITYLGMTAPIAVASILSWLRHPSKTNKSEVEVNKLRAREYPIILAVSAAVTVAFYFILRAFHTAQLLFSTLSVLTSFLAVCFAMRRSPLFAVAYALNDVVLIVLWSLAAAHDPAAITMIVCFSVFLVNDIYGFINWLRMKKRQRAQAETSESNLPNER